MTVTTAPLSLLRDRVRRTSLLDKLMKPEDTLQFFKPGQYLGWSGFTGVGYPKLVPKMLADHVERQKLQGQWKFNLFVGASSGAEIEDRWANLDMIDRRSPHQVGKNIQKGINEGRIRFSDRHLSQFPQDLLYGYYFRDKTEGARDKLDITVVEATAITEDGHLILGASVGATPELVLKSDKVIIEVNTAIPNFDGLHDIFVPDLPPYRKPILLDRVDNRIGSRGLYVDPEKVLAVVHSHGPDVTTHNAPADENSEAIASHIMDLLHFEVQQGRLPKNLLPLQSGIGNIANAIIGNMAKGNFHDVTVWTEVLQDTFLDFFDNEKLKFASATSVRFSPEGFSRFYENWHKYHDKILLRAQQISNHPELIRRLGVIAMNTPVEFDIYGHANSTLVNGSRMLNGLGGSGDFLRNAKLSIMHAPSARPSKNGDPTGISTVVPMCSHIDHTEHDVDIFVTEQGFADVRGLAPRDRARVVIDKCAHPDWKPILTEYLDLATRHCTMKKSLHEPQMLEKVFKLHVNLEKEGTMKIKNWD